MSIYILRIKLVTAVFRQVHYTHIYKIYIFLHLLYKIPWPLPTAETLSHSLSSVCQESYPEHSLSDSSRSQESGKRSSSTRRRAALPILLRTLSLLVGNSRERERDTLSYPPFLRFTRRGETRVVNSTRRRRERCVRLRAFEMPALTFAGRPARVARFSAESRDIARRSFVRPFVPRPYRIATCATLETFPPRASWTRVCVPMWVYECAYGWLKCPRFPRSEDSDKSRQTDKIRSEKSAGLSGCLACDKVRHAAAPTFPFFISSLLLSKIPFFGVSNDKSCVQ